MSRLVGLESVLRDAILVASELVTNAVRHSFCDEDDFLTVCITRDGCVRISVLDPGGPGSVARIVERPIQLGGLGLRVVDALARSWGADHRDEGYEVWAELALAG